MPATPEQREAWRAWLRAGAPGNRPPVNMELNMMCQRCRQILRCLPDECAPTPDPTPKPRPRKPRKGTLAWLLAEGHRRDGAR